MSNEERAFFRSLGPAMNRLRDVIDTPRGRMFEWPIAIVLGVIITIGLIWAHWIVVLMWFMTIGWTVFSRRTPAGVMNAAAWLYLHQSIPLLVLMLIIAGFVTRETDIAQGLVIIATSAFGIFVVCCAGVLIGGGVKWLLPRLRRQPQPDHCHCGYPTRGLRSFECPECGRSIRIEH